MIVRSAHPGGYCRKGLSPLTERERGRRLCGTAGCAALTPPVAPGRAAVTCRTSVPPSDRTSALQGIFHFQLGRGEPMLHTRLRPHCKEFLEKVARLYELHVFTFGSRLYAHTIAGEQPTVFCPAPDTHGRRVGVAPLLLNGGPCRWREGQRLCLTLPRPRSGGGGTGRPVLQNLHSPQSAVTLQS